jgi:hypothetical protein
MTNSKARVAKPGDIFLLLVPTAQELHHLRQQQTMLQARYGGQMVPLLHITCQRFTPQEEAFEASCIDIFKMELQNIQPFTIYTDKLIQFFAPYWQTQVLRWRVQETEVYASFRDKLDMTLTKTNCRSQFDRFRFASCTALNLENPIVLEENTPGFSFPAPLFTAKELLVSKLEDENHFEILSTITLNDG